MSGCYGLVCLQLLKLCQGLLCVVYILNRHGTYAPMQLGNICTILLSDRLKEFIASHAVGLYTEIASCEPTLWHSLRRHAARARGWTELSASSDRTRLYHTFINLRVAIHTV